MEAKNYRFETLQIHAGLQPDEATGARGVAIYPTAAYRFKSCDRAARLFDLSEAGNIYTRLSNPTVDALEQLAGCDAYFSVIISEADMRTYRNLGINVCCEPKYERQTYYHR